MKIRTFWIAGLIALVAVSTIFGGSKEELAQQAVSNDSAMSGAAIKNLRTMGKAGLDALFQTYSAEIAKFSASGEATDDWKRIAFALDSVAQQKDVYSSRLFWFTDLAQAEKEAAAVHKPILSLRLLGNLNEEFSCANSRFFRALLYSNSEISKYLRENYVLHWKSVRPAPKVTIDFGDGRRIERTLTGNSIHYILDENGAIIDAIPGLYDPADFLKYLTKGKEIAKTIAALPEEKRAAVLLGYRKQMFDEISAKRRQLIEFAQVKLSESADGTDAFPTEKPAATEIAPRAITKMVTEAPILTAITDDFSRFAPQIDLGDWKKLSKYYVAATRFDEASTAFIKRQNAKTGLTDAQMTSLLTNLTAYVALDTTRNDFLFHTKLYEWLNQKRAEPVELESFNSKVYAGLFKTPDSDAWLGLYNTDVYTALDGNGIINK
jgi:hypothetical protein